MGCGGSKGTFDVVIGDTLVESEFNVKTDPKTTMKFLCYAEEYPLNVEPGWEDGKAEMGEIHEAGKSFDVYLKSESGEKVKSAVISKRQVKGMKLSYHFHNMPGGNSLFDIDSIFELRPCAEGGTTIKRTMCNFKQLRNPELPLPKKIPGTIELQHKRLQMLLEEVAAGKRQIGESLAPLK